MELSLMKIITKTERVPLTDKLKIWLMDNYVFSSAPAVVEAIKRVREETGVGLKEAKDFVDSMDHFLRTKYAVHQAWRS